MRRGSSAIGMFSPPEMTEFAVELVGPAQVDDHERGAVADPLGQLCGVEPGERIGTQPPNHPRKKC